MASRLDSTRPRVPSALIEHSLEIARLVLAARRRRLGAMYAHVMPDTDEAVARALIGVAADLQHHPAQRLESRSGPPRRLPSAPKGRPRPSSPEPTVGDQAVKAGESPAPPSKPHSICAQPPHRGLEAARSKRGRATARRARARPRASLALPRRFRARSPGARRRRLGGRSGEALPRSGRLVWDAHSLETLKRMCPEGAGGGGIASAPPQHPPSGPVAGRRKHGQTAVQAAANREEGRRARLVISGCGQGFDDDDGRMETRPRRRGVSAARACSNPPRASPATRRCRARQPSAYPAHSGSVEAKGGAHGGELVGPIEITALRGEPSRPGEDPSVEQLARGVGLVGERHDVLVEDRVELEPSSELIERGDDESGRVHQDRELAGARNVEHPHSEREGPLRLAGDVFARIAASTRPREHPPATPSCRRRWCCG